jgi:hypothetical protein
LSQIFGRGCRIAPAFLIVTLAAEDSAFIFNGENGFQIRSSSRLFPPWRAKLILAAIFMLSFWEFAGRPQSVSSFALAAWMFEERPSAGPINRRRYGK